MVLDAVSSFILLIIVSGVATLHFITACRNGDIRLEGGSIQGSGRVKVCVDNEWGSVCNDSWTELNARVVCKQLGFPVFGELIKSMHYVSSQKHTLYQ